MKPISCDRTAWHEVKVAQRSRVWRTGRQKNRQLFLMIETLDATIVGILVALEYGLRTFDSSVGGLGGCPYAPGASGNVATEKLVSFLKKYGYQTKVNEERINFVASFVKNLLKNKQIT